ncbi:MAG: S-layer homology domain-containing protein [Candidatus Eremiobacteraeota bacterium]|nr:S-layer homology domain-containing protein [Candidatus Eremiobacteraeota bacterium]
MRTPFIVMLALACAVTVAGCTKTDRSSTTTAPDASAAPVSSAVPETVPSAAPATIASQAPVTSAPSPLPSVGLTDIDGVQGQKEIVQLAQLGVLDVTSGPFHPGDPVKRRDFVRWLFKANNAVWADQPSRQIHPADATAQSSFPDLASSDPDFRYVQGLSDAGIAVGFPDKKFKADQPLTREQMIAIKSGLDRGGVEKSYAADDSYAHYNLPSWKDKALVSKTYAAAVATDVQDDPKDGSPKIDNIGRTFGAIAMFRPQQPVTRAQAAVVLNVIGAHERFAAPRSVAQMLTATPGPSPSP